MPVTIDKILGDALLHTHDASDIIGLPSGAVDSVNGKTGTVVLTAGDVGAEPANANIQAHISSTSNPHSVTKTQVGLGSVDNVQQMPLSYLDADGTLSANSDTKVASQKATKTYADQLIASANALVYKGTRSLSNSNYPAADAGHMYIMSEAGVIGGFGGVTVEIGDMIICNTDGTPEGGQAAVGSKWNVIEKNIVGAVSGPASSTDGNMALFDGATGKLIKNGSPPPANTSASANQFITGYSSSTGAFSKAQPTWANIDKTTSNISDITTKSHTSLTDIGTNTHAQIDTALTRLANTSGTNTGDVTVTNTVSVDLSLTGQALSATVLPAGVDHGGLGGLGDDDHAQYALLSGRSGGQTLYGGTAGSDTLTLSGTSNATKGNILLNADGGNVAIGTSTVLTPKLNVVSNDGVTVENIASSLTTTVSTTTGVFAGNFAVYADPGATSTANYTGVQGTARTLATNGQNVTGSLRGLNFNIRHQGTGTVNTAQNIYIQNIVNGGGTITNAYDLFIVAPSVTGTGSAITNAYGLYIQSHTQGTNLNYNIYSQGTGINYFGGAVGIGITAPASGTDLHIGDSAGSVITLQRTDSSVTANDIVGKIQFYTTDTSTTTNPSAAEIEVQATNTIATDINPGRIIFRTTPTGVGATPLESFRITEAQDIQLADAVNIVVNTTTGTKIATSTAQKIGFYGATPITRPSAYTQTYSTADKTIANISIQTLTAASGTGDTTVADVGTAFNQTTLNNNFKDLANQINNAVTDITDLKQAVNAIIDDLQALGLVA